MYGSSLTPREKKALERENVSSANRTMREREGVAFTMREREAMRKQPERNTRKEKR